MASDVGRGKHSKSTGDGGPAARRVPTRAGFLTSYNQTRLMGHFFLHAIDECLPVRPLRRYRLNFFQYRSENPVFFTVAFARRRALPSLVHKKKEIFFRQPSERS